MHMVPSGDLESAIRAALTPDRIAAALRQLAAEVERRGAAGRASRLRAEAAALEARR